MRRPSTYARIELSQNVHPAQASDYVDVLFITHKAEYRHCVSATPEPAAPGGDVPAVADGPAA